MDTITINREDYPRRIVIHIGDPGDGLGLLGMVRVDMDDICYNPVNTASTIPLLEACSNLNDACANLVKTDVPSKNILDKDD